MGLTIGKSEDIMREKKVKIVEKINGVNIHKIQNKNKKLSTVNQASHQYEQ